MRNVSTGHEEERSRQQERRDSDEARLPYWSDIRGSLARSLARRREYFHPMPHFIFTRDRWLAAAPVDFAVLAVLVTLTQNCRESPRPMRE